MLFIIQHQTSELWLKLALHELRHAREELRADRLTGALKAVARVKKIQEVLTEQWAVLATLTPSEYAQFRGSLGNSSGFQSVQYRAVEFALGNKNARMLKVFESAPADHALLEAELHEPSLYDELLRLMARRGLPVPSRGAGARCHPGLRDERGACRRLCLDLFRPHRPLGLQRGLRGVRRPRGQLPVLAFPAHAHRCADNRTKQAPADPAAWDSCSGRSNSTFFPELFAVRTRIPS